jgi:uncharacterized protein (TIGR03089 family)
VTSPTPSPATPAPATFPALLADRLRRDPGSPLLTAYDEGSGERTELSGTTYANWVAKTANLLLDELLLDPGDTLLLALPPHWLGPVFLGAAWSAGLVVTTDPDADAAVVVCGPDLDPHRHRLGRGVPVVASALLPFGVRFPAAVPEGVTDYGLAWPGQPDAFVAPEPPQAGTPAWADGETQGALLARAAGAPAGRLITDADPAADHGVPAFLAPLVAGGSLVLVRNPRDAQWPVRLEGERATDVLRAG